MEEIARWALGHDTELVVITGGEPLIQQRAVATLAGLLAAQGRAVEVETNGTIAPLPQLVAAVSRFNVSPKLSAFGAGMPRRRRIVPAALDGFTATGKAAFKFVAGPADLEEIDALVAVFGLRPVWVMPEGTTRAAVLRGLRELADPVLARGWNLTPRLHTLIWGTNVADDGVPDLVVVGSVSSDRLRLAGGQLARVGGGAGLYASLGAAAVSTRVGLAGLYSDDLDGEPAAWLRARVDTAGLLRFPGRCLRFDIVYDEAGRAEYAVDGAEAEELISYRRLPEPFTHARAFHLCPTGVPAAQLAMAQALRVDPRATTAVVSATTFRNRITAAFDVVHALWSLVDLLVCNTEEAMLLTKRDTPNEARSRIADLVSDHQRCPVVVTHGAAGVDIVTAQGLFHVPSYPSRVVDPTGAGESFAGALLAACVAGEELPQAAVTAGAVASITVEGIGPAHLRCADPGELRRRAAAIAENGGIYV